MSSYFVCKHLILLVFCVLTVVLTAQSETTSISLTFKIYYNLYKFESSSAFKKCVCDMYTSCTLSQKGQSFEFITNEYQIATFPQSNFVGEFIYYVCNITEKAVTCIKKTSNIEACTSDCSLVKININCSGSGSQTLIWDINNQQKPTLVDYAGVDLFNCCSSSTTMPPTTTVRTTFNSNTRTQTTTSSTTQFSTDDSQAGSPDTHKPTFYSSLDTPTSTSSTEQQRTQEQTRSDSDTLISPTIIGIIVGTAVGAIFLTVAIMCLVWRIKTRRRNQTENKREASFSTAHPRNETNIMSHSSREPATENIRQPQRNVAHVLPIVPEGQPQNYYNAVTDNYTYIDIGTSERVPVDKSSKAEGNVTTKEIPSSSLNRDITQDTTSKLTTNSNRNPGTSKVSDNSDVYSKLHETQKVVFENPYDLGIENIDSRPTTSTQGTNNNHNSHLQATPLNVDASNKGKNARAPNQSNILKVIDVSPLTYTEVTPINSTSQLKDFQDTKGKKSLEILDSSRVTYAEIRPRKNKDVNLSETSQSSRDVHEDNAMPDRNTQNIQEMYSNFLSPNPVLSESYREQAYENVLKDDVMSPIAAGESFPTSMLHDKAPVVNFSGDITYANVI